MTELNNIPSLTMDGHPSVTPAFQGGMGALSIWEPSRLYLRKGGVSRTGWGPWLVVVPYQGTRRPYWGASMDRRASGCSWPDQPLLNAPGGDPGTGSQGNTVWWSACLHRAVSGFRQEPVPSWKRVQFTEGRYVPRQEGGVLSTRRSVKKTAPGLEAPRGGTMSVANTPADFGRFLKVTVCSPNIVEGVNHRPFTLSRGFLISS